MLEIINCNFKGLAGQNVFLSDFHNFLSNSFLQLHPNQLVIKDSMGTLIIFANGKFRVMGCTEELTAILLVDMYLSKIIKDFEPVLTLQSMTAKFTIGKKINLYKLNN